jgi:phage terminase large subunit-like protein
MAFYQQGSYVPQSIYHKYFQNKIKNMTMKTFLERSKKVDQETIPKDFRKFFIYVCTKSGLVSEKDACFPEYLSYLASVIIHRDIDTNKQVHGKNVVASTPPRHLKTTLCLAALLYNCVFYQGKKMVYASYSDSIAEEASKVFAKMAQAIGFAKLGTIADRLLNTSQVYFRAINGSVTGFGSNFITIIDDAVKNQQEAFSTVIRRQILTNFQSAFSTRRESMKVSTVIVGTRFHEEDLLGHCINELKYDTLVYPAIRKGKALFPELRPLDYLLDLKRQVGNYVWETLYMCSPPSATMNLNCFKKDIHYISEINLNDHREAIIDTAYGIDLAWKDKKENDLCAFVKMSLLKSGKVIITDQFCKQMDPESFLKVDKDRVPEGAELNWYSMATESGSSTMINKYLGINIKAKKSYGKLGNARPFSVGWNRDNVYIPDDWNNTAECELLKEILDFTGIPGMDINDDAIDAGSAAYDKLIKRVNYSSPDLSLMGI